MHITLYLKITATWCASSEVKLVYVILVKEPVLITIYEWSSMQEHQK
jgi:hypothetical protein